VQALPSFCLPAPVRRPSPQPLSILDTVDSGYSSRMAGEVTAVGKTHRKTPRSSDEAYAHPRYVRNQRNSTEEVFKCRHCKRFVCPPAYGSHHRNHCPFCLFSRHVDNHTGDRTSACGASMEPIGQFQRPNGEYMLVHQCLDCALERFNRIAADDNFDLVVSLPVLPPRTSREMKAQRLQEDIGEESVMHDIA